MTLQSDAISAGGEVSRRADRVENMAVMDDDAAALIGHPLPGMPRRIVAGRRAEADRVVVPDRPDREASAAPRLFDRQGEGQRRLRLVAGDCMHPLHVEMR